MCEYLNISQIFAQMRNGQIYIPMDNSVNIRYIIKENDIIKIEPVNRRLPIVVNDVIRFREVINYE